MLIKKIATISVTPNKWISKIIIL